MRRESAALILSQALNMRFATDVLLTCVAFDAADAEVLAQGGRKSRAYRCHSSAGRTLGEASEHGFRPFPKGRRWLLDRRPTRCRRTSGQLAIGAVRDENCRERLPQLAAFP
jgi:hypothetical protein